MHIYLTGILASLWISSTHHAVSEPSWIRVLTVVGRHDRDPHTLEVKWIKDCRAIVKVTLAQHINQWHHPWFLFGHDVVVRPVWSMLMWTVLREKKNIHFFCFTQNSQQFETLLLSGAQKPQTWWNISEKRNKQKMSFFLDVCPEVRETILIFSFGLLLLQFTCITNILTESWFTHC